MEKVRFKGVVIFKHETEEDWKKSSYIPEDGETVICDPDEIHDYPRIKIGNGVNMVKDLPFSGGSDGFIDVTELPTENINESATYRILEGTFVFNKMMRYDSTCHIVEWDPDSVPEEPGESVFTDNSGILSYCGYYNITNDTVYGYFGKDTIEYLKVWVNNSSLSNLIKPFIISYLNSLSAGWKTMQEIFSSVGSYLSISWGDVITSVESVDDENALYLYLSSKAFFYKNEEWIGLNSDTVVPGTGIGSIVFNNLNNLASGIAARAGGRNTKATGDNTNANGYNTTASGPNATSDGDNTTASGINSKAQGEKTTASGKNAFSKGCLTEATGNHSSAGGYDTKAKGEVASAEGLRTIAAGQAQTVIGRYNTEDNASQFAFIIGNGTESNSKHIRSNALTVDWAGNLTIAGMIHLGNGTTLADKDYLDTRLLKEGFYVRAGLRPETVAGDYSTAEGINNIITGIGSHAGGGLTEAAGSWSFTTGWETKAYGNSALAEGQFTTVGEGGVAAHVEGIFSTANGEAAHAEGYATAALGKYSHAGGYFTEAGDFQTVVGKCNAAEAEALFIVGCGSADTNGENKIVQNCFSTGHNGTEAYIKVGQTILTESQLKNLLSKL